MTLYDDACKHEFESVEEYYRHAKTSLHKIEVARKQINGILTALELDLSELK